MPTLASNSRTTWEKNKHDKVEFKYSGAAGTGKVSVKQEGAAESKDVPGHVDLIRSQAGSLTNNTDKTIEYTLS
jgi:hypothetical protein